MCLIADTVKRASDLSRGCRAFELSPICRIDGQESLVTVPVPQQNSKGKSKSLRLKYICYVLQAETWGHCDHFAAFLVKTNYSFQFPQQKHLYYESDPVFMSWQENFVDLKPWWKIKYYSYKKEKETNNCKAGKIVDFASQYKCSRASRKGEPGSLYISLEVVVKVALNVL
ncbi:hypothetical protein V6N12_011862 [Hibiscus sabdariffa]|uniref:Uncharacterized protein n=1 Tax=Hibiscus sabdariffa TaxID=183260 RepID=A0ABR2CGF6_9ROSI